MESYSRCFLVSEFFPSTLCSPRSIHIVSYSPGWINHVVFIGSAVDRRWGGFQCFAIGIVLLRTFYCMFCGQHTSAFLWVMCVGVELLSANTQL